MKHALISLLTLYTMVACACAAGDVADASVRYVNSRDVVLSFDAEGAGIAAADVWVSTDRGATWELSAGTRLLPSSVTATVPRDGRYDFFVILKNKAGASSGPPTRGETAHATVFVDTTPPLVQLHGARLSGPDAIVPHVALRASLVEENLSESAIRVFLKPKGGKTWVDAGVATYTDKEVEFDVPKQLSGPAAVRVIVTDRAGNCASGELGELVDLPARRRESSTTQPEAVAGVRESAEPMPEVDLEEAPAVAETPVGDVAALRALAKKHLSEGRYGLAAARLEDALRASPDDVDLLMLAGTAQFRAGQYDAANRGFSRALTLDAGNTHALEGLALVAATQRRYGDARDLLRRQLAVTPDDAKAWLRVGDMEQRLGNGPLAQRAWRKAAEVPGVDAETRAAAERRVRQFSEGAKGNKAGK